MEEMRGFPVNVDEQGRRDKKEKGLMGLRVKENTSLKFPKVVRPLRSFKERFEDKLAYGTLQTYVIFSSLSITSHCRCCRRRFRSSKARTSFRERRGTNNENDSSSGGGNSNMCCELFNPNKQSRVLDGPTQHEDSHRQIGERSLNVGARSRNYLKTALVETSLDFFIAD
ncbi:hypothetical protein M0804_002749 [Polistes exclamans]|nr:hypothetical protein M0804_002749 [Polistes exclamans]